MCGSYKSVLGPGSWATCAGGLPFLHTLHESIPPWVLSGSGCHGLIFHFLQETSSNGRVLIMGSIPFQTLNFASSLIRVDLHISLLVSISTRKLNINCSYSASAATNNQEYMIQSLWFLAVSLFLSTIWESLYLHEFILDIWASITTPACDHGLKVHQVLGRGDTDVKKLKKNITLKWKIKLLLYEQYLCEYKVGGDHNRRETFDFCKV